MMRNKWIASAMGTTVLLLQTTLAGAGEADIVGVRVERQDAGIYSFSVAVRHDDEGWDHYADRWEVLSAGGDILGTRVLLHPHVGEQPFTRSLSGVEVPAGAAHAIIRARDSVHGYGGAKRKVDLPGN